MPRPQPLVCVFVDCSIPMSLLFQRQLVFGKKTLHFLETITNRLRIPCYVSSSVDMMVRDKMKEISDRVGQVLSDFKQWLINTKVIGSGKTNLVSEDILDFQTFFTRKLRAISDERVKEEIRAIEIWIFDKALQLLREFKGKINIVGLLKTLFDFHDELFREKIAELDSYELRHKYWSLKKIEPLVEIQEVVDKAIFDQEDVPHLASVVQCQLEENLWVIFVSLDYRDIVGHKTDLFRKFMIIVCDPLYFELEYSRIIARYGTRRPVSCVSKYPERYIIVKKIFEWIRPHAEKQ